MTDTTSIANLPAAAAIDPKTAALLNPSSNSLPAGASDEKSLHEGSFLDFLTAFNDLPKTDKVLQSKR